MIARRTALAMLFATPAARAQEPRSLAPRRWPTGPVRIVSPYTPGGANDLLARFCAAHLSTAFGQPFVVENRPGAGGNLGAELVARAAPDGQTLLMGAGAVAINQALYPNLSFHILRDFVPVTLVALVPNLLVVNPRSPIRDMAGFVARAREAGITYGSAGNGTVPHVAMAMFLRAVGGRGTHVPYRGSAPAVTALLAGEVDALFENLPPLAEQVRSGSLRALAISTATRHADLPDTPTAAEAAGLPGFEVTAWQSLLAPARTPPEVAEAIATEIRRAITAPEGQARLAQLGAIGRGDAPAAFGRFLEAEVAKWAEAVAASGARAE